MASIGHIAVGLAAARAFAKGDAALQKKAAVAFSIVSIWPDVDVIGFHFGVHYGDPWGHRGATHSLVFALVIGLFAWALAPWRGLPRTRTALFAAAVAASHGLLDTMTFGGGMGVALFWPFSNARFWAPSALRIIPIAPIGMRILSPLGMKVMIAELFVFAPFWIYWLWPRRRVSGAGPR